MPSAAVDPGWHALVLHTSLYAELCDRVTGRFLHHNPQPGEGGRPAAAITETVAAIEAAGYRVDRKLWSHAPGGMTQCDSDDGRDYGPE